MTRNELITKLKENFDIRELVCPHCYKKFGEGSWQFLSTELLSTLYKLRYEIFQQPIVINNWHKGGKYDERGLRCNMCPLVKGKKSIYLSAHCLGMAIDFNVGKLKSDEVFPVIKYNAHRFDYPIRIEKYTDGWTHIDVYQPVGSDKDLIEFKG